MVAMTRWRSLFAGMVLTLIVGLGCSPAETALPLSSVDSADALGSQATESAPVPLAGSSSLGSDDTSGLGAFPAFLPPVAVGTDTQECHLGTDPYSTCI